MLPVMGRLSRYFVDLVVGVAGLIFVGVGVGLLIQQRPIKGGVVTTGTIVDQITKRDSDNSRSTYPVIEFTDQNERLHRFQSEIGGHGMGIEGKIGQIVKVRYDPRDPSDAQWADQPGQSLPVVAIVVGGLIWLGEVGLVGWRLYRRRATR